MGTQYTANIYCGADEIAHQSGDNMEQLYVWMLAYVEKNSGEIIDNSTHQVVRQFKKQSIE
ncbi:hypothetical protein [Legionella waltersii]|uniref:Uncharacterized protein n=1 Tax=Legionella waltersii TaxID=66969 RepID=A0A0W1AMW1_9GAMM|nr:hypothetical protein [Legionella waltersii]KTD82673.1 hypothetical protein Lwal_0493 [Legionella waltersii]SNU95530.1 Uncharacterised protein [Legionella waltersii]